MTKSQKLLLFSILSLVLLNMSLAPRIFAGTVSYDFTAKITSWPYPGTLIDNSIALGDTFTGDITFDPQQAISSENQGTESYGWLAPNNGITINIGQTTLTTHSTVLPLGIGMSKTSNYDSVSIGGDINYPIEVFIFLEGWPDACLESRELSSFPTNVSCFTRENWISIKDAGSIRVFGKIESITLRTPSTLINNLINAVGQLNLRAGIANSLDSKLQNALDALNAARSGNNASAINKLNAFINSVNAQRGSGLTNQEADYLINLANQIIAAISSQ